MPLALLCAAVVVVLVSLAWAAPAAAVDWCEHYVPCLDGAVEDSPQHAASAALTTCLADPGCVGGFSLACGGLLVAGLLSARVGPQPPPGRWSRQSASVLRRLAKPPLGGIDHPPRDLELTR